MANNELSEVNTIEIKTESTPIPASENEKRESKNKEHRPSYLNPDHTHFILTDNNDSSDKSYTKEINFRSEFETRLKEQFKMPIGILIVINSIKHLTPNIKFYN